MENFQKLIFGACKENLEFKKMIEKRKA